MLSDSDNSKMDSQFCNDNNDSSNSTKDTKNNNTCYDSVDILNYDEPIKTQKVTDIDEFEQVLSEYKEQQRNFDINTEITNLNTANESIVIETIINMGIDLAETNINVNNCKTRQVDVNSNEVCIHYSEKLDMNEYLPINNIDNINKEEPLQSIKTEIGTVSLISSEGLINENNHNLDLNALTNIFDSNENKSLEIDIDINNEITDERIINNSIYENFAEAGPSEVNYTNFEIDDIELCDNSSINDINHIIHLTDSPRLDFEKSHTATNDISNIENTSGFRNGDNESKDNISDKESDCSFHSSDFELITEDEARLDGLIINFRQQNEICDERSLNNENRIDMYLPGPSDDYAYRENHRIPEGDEFFNMFHGIYAPANIPHLIFLENKSVVPTHCMDVENDKFGFDLVSLNKEVFDKEYQDEAKETAKKILSTYHDVNDRKRSRRFL